MTIPIVKDIKVFLNNIHIETFSSRGIKFGGDDITKLMIDEVFCKNYQDVIDKEINKRMKNSFLDSDGFTDEDKVVGSAIYNRHLENYRHYHCIFNTFLWWLQSQSGHMR